MLLSKSRGKRWSLRHVFAIAAAVAGMAPAAPAAAYLTDASGTVDGHGTWSYNNAANTSSLNVHCEGIVLGATCSFAIHGYGNFLTESMSGTGTFTYGPHDNAVNWFTAFSTVWMYGQDEKGRAFGARGDINFGSSGDSELTVVLHVNYTQGWIEDGRWLEGLT